MDGVFFSIIITVYNIEKYIGECIESILSQGYSDYEIVCVDDCSTDNSNVILEKYSQMDDRIKIVKTPNNSGLASARNLGIRTAVGKYIYNIDGDDLLAENALQIMHDYMEKNRLDMLSFSALSFFEDEQFKNNGDVYEYIRKNEYEGLWDGRELFAELYKNNDRVNGNMVLYCFNRQFIIDNELFLSEGLRYCDDRMFSIFMSARRVMCINEPLYFRRYRYGSVVTSPMKKVFLESLIICFVSEQIVWSRICRELSDDINMQISSYFDDRLREISDFENMFKNDNTEMQLLNKHPMEKYIYERVYRKKSIYSRMISEVDKKRIIDAENVYIYGTGEVAKKVTDFIETLHLNHYSYVVTNNTGNETEFLGKKLFEIEDLSYDKGSLFIVAVSSKYRNEIVDTLKNNGQLNYCLVLEG